jgi:hypothetical protein
MQSSDFNQGFFYAMKLGNIFRHITYKLMGILIISSIQAAL